MKSKFSVARVAIIFIYCTDSFNGSDVALIFNEKYIFMFFFILNIATYGKKI